MSVRTFATGVAVVAIVAIVAIVAGCSRSAPPDDHVAKPAPEESVREPVPERVAPSDDERALLESLETKIHERDPSMAVVTDETVERYGQKLGQYRIGSPSFKSRLPASIDVPTIVMYSPIEDCAGSSEAASAFIDSVGKAMDLIPDLMRHGQLAAQPLVIWFAVKPGRRTRSWVSGLEKPLLIQDRNRLIHDLGAVAVPEVKRLLLIGVVFPSPDERVNAFDLPMPADWAAAKAQATKPLLFPDELFAMVWPD